MGTSAHRRRCPDEPPRRGVEPDGTSPADRGDDFLAVACHELRSPLAIIKGYAQLLNRVLADPSMVSQQKLALQMINTQVDRMSRLIEDLTDVARIRAGQLRLRPWPTDLVALARRVSSNLALTEMKHPIRVESDTDELWGTWDAARLEQVLINLMNNAIKYSPEGCEIRVRIAGHAETVQIAVQDHGIGMSPDVGATIFERFARGDAAKALHPEGLGLGLYISQSIVIAHNGQIWAESSDGAGSTFYVSLPRECQP